MNALDASGLAFIHYAAQNDTRDLHSALMLGGNPNLLDGEGKAPLHHAVIKNNARNAAVRVFPVSSILETTNMLKN